MASVPARWRTWKSIKVQGDFRPHLWLQAPLSGAQFTRSPVLRILAPIVPTTRRLWWRRTSLANRQLQLNRQDRGSSTVKTTRSKCHKFSCQMTIRLTADLNLWLEVWIQISGKLAPFPSIWGTLQTLKRPSVTKWASILSNLLLRSTKKVYSRRLWGSSRVESSKLPWTSLWWASKLVSLDKPLQTLSYGRSSRRQKRRKLREPKRNLSQNQSESKMISWSLTIWKKTQMSSRRKCRMRIWRIQNS